MYVLVFFSCAWKENFSPKADLMTSFTRVLIRCSMLTTNQYEYNDVIHSASGLNEFFPGTSVFMHCDPGVSVKFVLAFV